MSFQGLDPERIKQTADTLERQAGALDGVASHVDGLIRTAMHHWSGPEANDFHQWWVGQHRPKLVAAAQGLHGAAGNVRRQVAEQERASGGGVVSTGPHRATWIDPTDPEVKVKGTHTFVKGEHVENQTGPGSTESGDLGVVDGSASLTMGKDGAVLAAGVSATAVGVQSANHFRGSGGMSGDLNASARVGADAGASARIGPGGGSVGAQAMVGASVGADGAVGNDSLRVRGRVEAVAGIGGEIHGDARFEGGKLKIGYKGGLAVGLGAKLGGNVELDVSGAQHAADEARRNVSHWLRGN